MADVILILDDEHWQPVFLKFPAYLYTRLMYMTVHKVMCNLENTYSCIVYKFRLKYHLQSITWT